MCRVRRLSSSRRRSWEKQAQQTMVSRLIYLIGSQDARQPGALRPVSVRLISANCTLVKPSSDPAHLILSSYISEAKADVETSYSSFVRPP